jgi:dihydrofolate reductase
MRRLRYQVACSLDGFIAGPDDGYDWITPEPTFDFEALYAQFDTLLMGRRTYEPHCGQSRADIVVPTFSTAPSLGASDATV